MKQFIIAAALFLGLISTSQADDQLTVLRKCNNVANLAGSFRDVALEIQEARPDYTRIGESFLDVISKKNGQPFADQLKPTVAYAAYLLGANANLVNKMTGTQAEHYTLGICIKEGLKKAK